MDAVIRFCFSGIDPEKLNEDEYAKMYGQAKWVLDYTTLMMAKKSLQSQNG